MASQVFQHPVQTMRSFCARSVGVVDGGDEEGEYDDGDNDNHDADGNDDDANGQSAGCRSTPVMDETFMIAMMIMMIDVNE